MEPANDQSAILVRNAVAGDERALQRLLLLYHPRLRARLVRQMDETMKGRLEPEDILQQVYLEAFRAVGTFQYQGADSFLRWLFTILDRKLIDEHRALHAERRDVRREVRGAPPSPTDGASYVDLLQRLTAEVGTASRVVRRNEALGALAVCLAALPDHYRDVIRLRFIEGLPVADVATRLKRTNGSIHMICHRALTALREEMDKLDLRPE
ncbi:MAG: RNA polymerase sigma factor [Phycisphaerae bacterium]